MPRIISGEYGGRVIKAPARHVRPTSDKVKEYIFNVIRDWDGCVVTDLFAGSGSLGLEAISRGASFVDFVDNHYDSIRTIALNLTLFPDHEKQARIFKSNALTHCKHYSDHYDRVLADPPYKCDLPETFFTLVALSLKKGGLFILEYSVHGKEKIRTGMTLVKERYFGETGVWIYEK
jgi:16S rRNA (guanine966-N2)-methyltransferase